MKQVHTGTRILLTILAVLVLISSSVFYRLHVRRTIEEDCLAVPERPGLERFWADVLANHARNAEVVVLGMCEAVGTNRIGILDNRPFDGFCEVLIVQFRVLRWLVGGDADSPRTLNVCYERFIPDPADEKVAPEWIWDATSPVFLEQALHERFGEEPEDTIFGGLAPSYFKEAGGIFEDCNEIDILFLDPSFDRFRNGRPFFAGEGISIPSNALFFVDGAVLSELRPEAPPRRRNGGRR